MTGNELRRAFLDYFVLKGHNHVPSSSLVPINDPTLLFTNAGMVQFKDVFLGMDKRTYSRATTAQKCVRAGGKHNDLDTVGRTARHHTFFEMMGNFSFGDYFKREAISFAWEFLTKIIKLDQDRLWVTVFRDDDEAAALWQETTGMPATRIIRLGEKDNFWSMGDTGPCGPCSEVIYDRGPEKACQAGICAIGECDCDRWLEIWNLVFMQYDRDVSGELTPLPRPSIDTGMGLERVLSILQGVDSNFETDFLFPLIQEVERISGKSYQGGEKGFPFRVIADHARSCTFLINDGVLPGNEGRSYVLRRILRRAVRFGKALGIEGAFLFRMVPVVAAIMGGGYPELLSEVRNIQRVVQTEEKRFQQTLNEGLRVVQEIVGRAHNEGRSRIGGHDAFLLYDTYGFPLDLTEDIASENNLMVDKDGFEEAMNQQKERARAARGDQSGLYGEASWNSLVADVAPTGFVGYGELESHAVVQAIVSNHKRVQEASPGEEAVLLLDVTPCYAEGGGQAGDRGRVFAPGFEFEIEDTRRIAEGRILHLGRIVSGSIHVGQGVTVAVDAPRRQAAARNHTATHLLHRALRDALGSHVNQAGSLVNSERLRFDFSHFASLSPEEISMVEEAVNEKILKAIPIDTLETTLEEAQSLGAMALFSEKYGDKVRLVRVGDYSLELCGGTHVRSTSEIGSFKLISEGAIGAGARRIEAVTGLAALGVYRDLDGILSALEAELKGSRDQLVARVAELQDEFRARGKELEALYGKLAKYQVDELLREVCLVQGVKVAVAKVNVGDRNQLRSFADVLRDRLGSGVLVLAGRREEGAEMVAMVTKDLVQRGLHAGNLIKGIAAAAGGGGGGRPDMAQAGIKNASRLDDALKVAPRLVEDQLQKR